MPEIVNANVLEAGARSRALPEWLKVGKPGAGQGTDKDQGLQPANVPEHINRRLTGMDNLHSVLESGSRNDFPEISAIFSASAKSGFPPSLPHCAASTLARLMTNALPVALTTPRGPIAWRKPCWARQARFVNHMQSQFPANLELHPNHSGCVKKNYETDIDSLLVTADDKKTAKLEIEMAMKKGPRNAAAKKSAKRGVRNPVATLTKTHAAATKKVATAQKVLDRAIAAEQKAAAKLAAATAKAEAKAAKLAAR